MSGGKPAKVPTGPDIIPTAIRGISSQMRSRCRCISDSHNASFNPKLIGSACIPCERPMHRVRLCSRARPRKASHSAPISRRISCAASTICKLNAVSFTSLDVSPWWIQRPSGPRLPATARVKETMSCFVSSKWRSYSEREKEALRIAAISSAVIARSSLQASHAAISIRSQSSNW